MFFLFCVCVENLTFMLLFDRKQSCTVKAHSTAGRVWRDDWGEEEDEEEEGEEEEGASEQAEQRLEAA